MDEQYCVYIILTHTVLTAIFPGELGLAGWPLNCPSAFILAHHFGTGLNFPCHS